jgi:outer membrane protein assembly factor BamB
MSFICICVIISTCKKEPPPQSQPYRNIFEPKKSVLPLIWSTYLDVQTKQQTSSINPILNSEGNVLMSNFSLQSNREPMALYDGKTGKLKWTWDDYFRNEGGFWDRSHTVVNDVLVLSAHNATYALNMLTGQTVWKHYMDTMYGSPFVFNDGEYVYKSFIGETGSYSNHIFRTRYDNINWELVCTYTDSTRKFDDIYNAAMAFTQNDNGDKLLVAAFNCACSTDLFALIYCYNISKQRFEWLHNYDDRYAAFWNASMQASNQKAFTTAHYGGEMHLSAFNLNDGSIAWDQIIPDIGVGLFLYKDNIISTCNGAKPVSCYSQNSGELVWKQDFANEHFPLTLNFTFGDASIFKNYLFSTQCDNLLVLNADNGNVVFNDQVALPNACLEYGVAINEKERTFYVQDRTYVNCYKLPQQVTY